MNVTINTDASHAQNMKCGAFALYIISDQGKILKAGKLKGEIFTSQHAESCAISNSLYLLLHSKWNGIKKIIINTDSQYCIDVINGDGRCEIKTMFVFDEIRVLIFELCLKHGFPLRNWKKLVEFRHVKAHKGKPDSRSAVNDWCDKQAKKYLKILIKEKQQNGN